MAIDTKILQDYIRVLQNISSHDGITNKELNDQFVASLSQLLPEIVGGASADGGVVGMLSNPVVVKHRQVSDPEYSFNRYSHAGPALYISKSQAAPAVSSDPVFTIDIPFGQTDGFIVRDGSRRWKVNQREFKVNILDENGATAHEAILTTSDSSWVFWFDHDKNKWAYGRTTKGGFALVGSVHYDYVDFPLTESEKFLQHAGYDVSTERATLDVALETTLNSLYLGKQHKMSSGAENIYFTNLASDINYYPSWGGLKDQSVVTNQGSSGLIAPTGRVFGSYSVFPSGGNPMPGSSAPYDASSFYPDNISGLSIGVVLAESVGPDITLRYNIAVNGVAVYEQILEHNTLSSGQFKEWFFDHPLDVIGGSTNTAKITKVDAEGNDLGPLMVQMGDNGQNRYHVSVGSRSFEDKELAYKDDINALSLGSQYKGAYNADTDTPSLPTGTDVLGDTYRVNVSAGIYEVGDLLIFNGTTYDHIPVNAVTQDTIENGTLKVYDWYVKPNYVGTISNGSALYPFLTVQQALNASNPNDSIFLDGIDVVTQVTTIPHGISLFGSPGSTMKHLHFNPSNGGILQFIGTGSEEIYISDIIFRNASGIAVDIQKTKITELRRCRGFNNGWDGTQLNTILPKLVTGGIGYDSLQSELQAFNASPHTSDGGFIVLEECQFPLIRECRSGDTSGGGNFRSIKLIDCGINGGGFVIECRVSGNIESGIMLSPGTLGGCQNITCAINYSGFNANNGTIAIGGLNNKFSQNEVHGNWSGAFVNWASANLTWRDGGMYDNNRSRFNGAGNLGDAWASVQVRDAASYLATNFSLNPDRRFIMEFLDSQVHYTGIGSNTKKIGFYIGAEMSALPYDERNVIKVDDVGFMGQDIGIDLSEVDTSNLKVVLGDNSFVNIAETNIKEPLEGLYYELPFSNHITNLIQADFEVTNTGNIVIREGSGGKVVNPYKVNDLQAVGRNGEIAIILKGTNKIQFTVPIAGASITDQNGSHFVNSVLNQALVDLNNLFTNTTGFASGGNPVTGLALVNNDLTVTLQDGTSFTADVTTLGVDENLFLDSVQLVGTDIEFTMSDGTTVHTLDGRNLINGSTLSSLGQGWFVSYGANANSQIGNPTSGQYSFDNSPLHFGQTLEVGTTLTWTQYELLNNASVFMSIGVWNGATNGVSGGNSTSVTNWSTKIGFFSNTITQDTSTFPNGGYSSKNTDVGAGVTYTSGAVMRLVYGSDYRLRLYAGDVLLLTTIVPETGNPLTISHIASNNGVEFPSMTKIFSDWEIIHDFDSSETSILDGIEDDTVIRSRVEISPGEKAMINLNIAGENERIGFGYTGNGINNVNSYLDVIDSFIYGSSEQIVPQDGNDWNFNTSAFYSVNSARWGRGSNLYAGMTALRYHNDFSVDLYSETYSEVIATKALNLNGAPFSVYIGASMPMSFSAIPSISKQTIGQSFQPSASSAPSISNQTFEVTEDQAFSIQVALDTGSRIVNQFDIVDDQWSFVQIDGTTGVITGTAPPVTGSDTYLIYCKAGNAIGGVTNFIITLNVVAGYTNTKSLKFQQNVNSYLNGNASNVTALQRTGNGSGSSDSWTIDFLVKPSNIAQNQTWFHYGGNNESTKGGIKIGQSSLGTGVLVIRYGTSSDYIGFLAMSALTPGTWQHIMVTYDGGTTGVNSADIAQYSSRFKVFVDGVELTTAANTLTAVNGNNGYDGDIEDDSFTVGKLLSTEHIANVILNRLCIWNSDQSANIAGIFNSGNIQDMTDSTTMDGTVDATYAAPDHYYEVETSVTTISDINGSASLSGFLFTSSDLVTDIP